MGGDHVAEVVAAAVTCRGIAAGEGRNRHLRELGTVMVDVT